LWLNSLLTTLHSSWFKMFLCYRNWNYYSETCNTDTFSQMSGPYVGQWCDVMALYEPLVRPFSTRRFFIQRLQAFAKEFRNDQNDSQYSSRPPSWIYFNQKLSHLVTWLWSSSISAIITVITTICVLHCYYLVFCTIFYILFFLPFTLNKVIYIYIYISLAECSTSADSGRSVRSGFIVSRASLRSSSS